MSTRTYFIAVVFAAMLCQPLQAADKLVISNWDAYMPPDLLENFTQETGIETELAVHATNEEIMGKLTANGGRGYDIVFVSSPFAEALDKLGLAALLDPAKIPNMANLYPQARRLPYDPGNTFSIPYAWGTTGLCYRSDLVSGTPSSWNDLLQPSAELDGKITMLSTERWLLAAGFLSLGYSINTTSPQEINAAKDALIAAKKHLLAFDDATFYSKLVSGEALLTHAWDGWCNYGILEDDNIRYVVPDEGTDLWVDTLVVMSASRNKDAAHQFVNYVLGAEVGKWIAENLLYKTPNQVAMESLSPALFEQFPNMAFDPVDMLNYEMLRDLGRTQRDYTRAATEIMAAN